MKKILIHPEFSSKWPHFAYAAISCQLKVEASSPALLARIAQACDQIAARLRIEDIHGLPAIAATRDAYKALGKEPSRYRPSAEALLRRVIQGKGLYAVNNVVDLLNLVSIGTGFSIGGWDESAIAGEQIELGVGRADEPYESIGRGQLNIEFFPVFRDAEGAFGTPTSDSDRTSVRPPTTRFLMLFYGFGGKEGLEAGMQQALALLGEFAQASYIVTQIESTDGI